MTKYIQKVKGVPTTKTVPLHPETYKRLRMYAIHTGQSVVGLVDDILDKALPKNPFNKK